MPEQQTDSDQTLLEDFQQDGDISILGELYQRHMHLVYGVSLKYLKNREEAQDAVSNIFEELLAKVKKHQIDNFKSWLYVLTKNHCLMALRKQSTKTSSLDFSDSFMENSLAEHPSEKIDLEDNLVRLEQCISQLKADQRSCVELFYLQKKCYQEIVDVTHFQLKKVKSYIQNGKRNLKLCMEQSE
ncbi:sigma-70 family RNA polymerase sigma factor [Reichenbachiella agarivorans]|uniref:Sigma-70 family RNA polymerase sigma factor n=1 Tax=Reichenbachiella agarivorans TaxID=2979464 RepID=A0ABY6CS93_9BACT|nr:sigma-70 family RNA polymerase sigma factor [Reichenbachiella agarivorans]UXP33387.1 sigma-70 family RNA polymerase sigma factor [Reichenbachiella agarivorans]